MNRLAGRFGANAAWLRLTVMTQNVLTALKRVALKPEHLRAQHKRLRFQIFCSPGALCVSVNSDAATDFPRIQSLLWDGL